MTPSRFAMGMYVFAAVLGLLGVALAALTSHGLNALAPAGDQAVEWFKIATSFQINHTLGLILVTTIADQLAAGRARRIMQAGAVLLGAGAFLFPTALYSLSFAGPSVWAPYGGFAAMAGWIAFGVGAVMAFKSKPAT